MAHPIFEAIEAGDAERVRALVAEDPGAASARDDQGVSALLRARYAFRDELVDAVRSGNPALDVFDAAAFGEVDRLMELLDADPGLAQARSGDGFTALHLAAFFGRPVASSLLLDRGADPAAVAENDLRVMPLHSAAAAGSNAVALQLLEAGAPAGATQSGGFTPLHAAAAKGNTELVELLLSYHADPDPVNDEGKRPRDLAEEQGHAEIVTLLEVV